MDRFEPQVAAVNESAELVNGVDRRQRAEISRMLEAVTRAHVQVDAAPKRVHLAPRLDARSEKTMED